MSNIDKQALIAKIKKQTESYDTVVLREDEANALLDELEAKDRMVAEPVHQVLIGDAWVDLSKGAMDSQKRVGAIVRTVYTAPPAPVSVPDEVSWEDVPEEITEDDMALASAWAHGFNQCRAAMLYGDENAESRCTIQTAPALDSSPKIVESRCSNSPVIPDGFCIMPKKLTAENGGKGALSGEFYVTTRIVCQSCGGEGCEDCNDEGGLDAEIPVIWDTIKRIHEAAVEACSLPAAPQQEVKNG